MFGRNGSWQRMKKYERFEAQLILRFTTFSMTLILNSPIPPAKTHRVQAGTINKENVALTRENRNRAITPLQEKCDSIFRLRARANAWICSCYYWRNFHRFPGLSHNEHLRNGPCLWSKQGRVTARSFLSRRCINEYAEQLNRCDGCIKNGRFAKRSKVFVLNQPTTTTHHVQTV